MMAASTHFKLGLLVLASVLALGVIVVVLGLRTTPTDTYHTYFDESVQGLEVGAVVKYRGVRIGTVSAIEIAPDRRHVHVELAIEQPAARRIGLSAVGPAARAQLALLGITGLKIVDIDVVDPAFHPPPTLPFSPEQPYIPSRPSVLTGIQRGVETTGDQLVVLVKETLETLDKLQKVLDGLLEQQLPERIASAVDAAGQAATDLQKFTRALDEGDVADKLVSAADSLERGTRRLDAIMQRVEAKGGVLADAERATTRLGDFARSATESTAELDQTIRELGDAARAVRRFVQALERQPDMLLRGRRRTGP